MTKMICFRMPDEAKIKLKIMAAQANSSINELLSNAVNDMIERFEKDQDKFIKKIKR